MIFIPVASHWWRVAFCMALRGKTPAYKKYRNLLEEKQSTKPHNASQNLEKFLLHAPCAFLAS